MKKFNFYFQLVAVITVAFLYLWIFPGMVAHVVLGGVQLFSALVVLVQFNKWSKTVRTGIIIYWALVVLTAISFYLAIFLYLPEGWYTGTMVFTGGIAIYFTWLSYRIMEGETRMRRRGNFSILDFPND
jgi:hypothetical protein